MQYKYDNDGFYVGLVTDGGTDIAPDLTNHPLEDYVVKFVDGSWTYTPRFHKQMELEEDNNDGFWTDERIAINKLLIKASTRLEQYKEFQLTATVLGITDVIEDCRNKRLELAREVATYKKQLYGDIDTDETTDNNFNTDTPTNSATDNNIPNDGTNVGTGNTDTSAGVVDNTNTETSDAERADASVPSIDNTSSSNTSDNSAGNADTNTNTNINETTVQSVSDKASDSEATNG